jgi:acetyl esterase/lipase
MGKGISSIVLLLAACAGVSPPMDAGSGGESVAVVRNCRPLRPPAAGEIDWSPNLTYAVMGAQTQRLDFAAPRGGAPYPLVVLIHGGGWSGGDKSAYHSAMRLLVGQGYAAASVSYRLAAAPHNVFPAAVEDVRCAVRWLRANADRLGIDAERIAAMGSSAGGHLAAMLGTAARVEGLDGECPLREVSPAVSAVVALAGPHDIRTAGALDRIQRGMVENFLGVTPEADPQRALLASPAVHADPRNPPFLLVHGTADNVVPIRQSRSMRDTLRASGVPATLVELPGVGHDVVEFSDAARFRASACTILRFLDEQLRQGS